MPVRDRKDGIYTNTQLKPWQLKRYCGLDQPAHALLERARIRLRLSALRIKHRPAEGSTVIRSRGVAARARHRLR